MIKNCVKEIKKQGFTLIPNVITKKECEKYKKLLEAYHKKYSGRYASFSQKKNCSR